MAPASPNPFREATRIAYTLPRTEPVKAEVFDVQGRRVAVLVDETQLAGAHQAAWDGRSATGAPASAGFYLIRLRAGEQSQVRKVLLMK
jgi:flagellar hook assembly protein FlgD